MTPHPLDPLSADEIRRAAGILRRDQRRRPTAGASPRSSCASRRRRRSGTAPPSAAAVVICWNRDDGARLQGARQRSPPTPSRRGTSPRRPAEHDRRRVPRVRRGAAQGPARDRGARRARDHRHGPRPDRHLGLRRAPRPRAAPRRPDRLGRRLVPQGSPARARTRTRSPACTSSSTSTGWSCSRSRTPTASTSRDTMGEYVPHLVPGLKQRDRHQAARDHPARGRLVHARRQPAELAEVVAARRLQPPRGHGPAHASATTAARSRTASASPRWSSPTATRRPTTTAARRSTSASGASAS